MIARLQSIDLWLHGMLTPFHSPVLDTAMSWISIAGGAAAVWLVLAAVAAWSPRTRAAAWRLVLTVLLSYVAVDGMLKPLAARERPSIDATAPARQLPPLPRTASFPSGHMASSAGAAIAVARMWPPLRVAAWSMAALIGYSRIYLGHHYPLDVAGGAIVGVLIALWVLGGRHPATYADARPIIRPREIGG